MSEESQILVASGSGIQTVVPQLAATAPQIVYLDFDGAETSYYNPDLDIAIDNIVVEDSGFDSESITLIIDALNEQFGDDVVFTADLPTDTDAYSTIYVGVTSAFDGYGSFHGLAETIDSGNQIRDDNAFVFLNSAVATEFVTSVIAHETEHIVSGMEHGGEGLERYAHTYIIENGEKIGPGWLEDGDRMIIKDGGSAEHMQIFCGVNVSVCSGGFAYNTFLQNGASMSVDNGGIASYTTLEGMMSVNGMAVNTDGAGSMFVFGGGTATSTHLYTGGTLHVVNDGTANNTTVDGGTLYVDHFGTANNTTVSSGGTLYVDYDGRLKGSLQIASGATVSVESGAIMEFTVAEQENASIALFNHYDYLQGAENAIYTIIVKEDQAIGQYALADFASAFNETITVTVMTTSYTILGNLTVGSSFEHDSKLYHLLLDGNTLVLDIPDITPPVITLEGDTTTTLQSASLTASANEAADISFNTVSSEYDGAWTNYTGALTVTDNGTWYFKAIDAAGNIGTASITFNNIKSMGPEIELTGDNTTPLQSTTLTATTEEGVDIYYSPDGKFWAKYDGEIEITTNCTWYFKATDAFGNVGTNSITFNNIDTMAPVITLTGENTAPSQATMLTASTEAGLDIFYSTDNATWTKYTDSIEVTVNGTWYFKATDVVGHVGTNSITFNNIDTTAPVIELTGDNTTPLQSTTLTAATEEGVDIYYSPDGKFWAKYDGEIEITTNCTWYFKATDAAGNVGTNSITFNNITTPAPGHTPPDDTEPPIINLSGDTTTPLQKTTLTATTEEGVDIYYSPDGKFWAKYDGEIEITANCTWYFKATDAAGNTGTAQITFENIDTTAPILSNIDISAPNESGLAAITVEANETLSKLEYSWKEGEWLDASDGTISVAENGSVQFRLTDLAGNVSVTDSYVVEAFNAKVTTIETVTTDDGAVISWIDDGTAIWSKNYDIAIGSNAGIINLTNVLAGGVELLNTPSGEMAISVKPSQSDIWTDAGSVNVQNEHEATSQYIVAEDNGLADVIFASALFEWNGNYQAQHVGAGEWNGTGETAALAGKNAISDIFAGSDDASILLLTDDTNGDALFIEDIYSAFPEGFDAQARLAKIDEIRAGAGDDVIDLTSQRFDYVGGGMTVKGGLGDDVIWANNGDNTLFGDAGNDRIVGAGGNDVIVGGVGNDSMHGGGGEDIFAFGGDWGIDSVEQLENGKVTLWFDEGSIDKWDASTLTYRDGDKSVVVNGVAAENISLKFGDDGSEQYGKLLEMGAFDEFSSERIFENNNKRGTLA